MSTSKSEHSQPKPVGSLTSKKAKSIPGYWMDLLFLAAFLAHIPVGIEYCRRMWIVGHYQFFPLLAAAAGWLIFDRLANQGQRQQRTQAIYPLLFLNALILMVSVLLYAPFFWIGSMLLLLVIYVYDRWGWSGLKVAAPAGMLLFFIVPMPANLDLKIVNNMQFMASQLASWILDAFGQVHFREGVVLITEKKYFFTEEACSGIRSLFSSLAAIAIYGVMRHYPLWRHAFNLVQTILWVIVGNAIRVASVVYLADNVDESFASGTTHEMLGLASFVFIFLCAMSTDRGINAWHASRVNVNQDALESETAKSTASETPAVLVEQTDPIPAAKWVLVGVFGVILLFGGRLAYAKIAEDQLNYYDEDDFVMLVETDLPEVVNGWKRTSFSFQEREDTRLLAPESFVWTYSKAGRKATVSLDSPYYDFHNLNDCYEGFGWDVEYEHIYPDNNDLTQLSNLTKLDMTKTNEFGMVMFTAFDRNGQLVRPNSAGINYAPSRLTIMKRNANLALGLLDQTNDPRMSKQPLPISQVQLLHKSSRSIAEKADLDALFVQCRALLQRSKRFAANRE